MGLDPQTAVEVEAVPPGELRERVERAVLAHVEPDAWRAVRAAEQSEREVFARMAARFNTDGGWGAS